MPPFVHLNPGDQLYKFQLRGCLGGGAYGDVWLAHDHSISRDMAVKVLASNVTIDERLQEARIGNHLNHQNLVKIHYADVVQHNGIDLVIIAMDYHPNGSIINGVNAGNFMPIPDVIRYMVDILRGLEYLHELNLYHSDIKPQNILIGTCGQGVLSDYGISCHSPVGCSAPHRGFYKLHAASEVLQTGQMNVQTDVYQVGMTAFRLLNGIGTIEEKFNRFGESHFNQLVQQGKIVQSGDYQPYIPRNLKSAINKAIHVDPASRYQSAVEMRRVLERLSYPGFWTCDPSGGFVGHNVNYEFRFEEQPKGGKLFAFTAFKKNKTTGRETRIGDHSAKNITLKQTEDLQRNFMQWVVTGNDLKE